MKEAPSANRVFSALRLAEIVENPSEGEYWVLAQCFYGSSSPRDFLTEIAKLAGLTPAQP